MNLSAFLSAQEARCRAVPLPHLVAVPAPKVVVRDRSAYRAQCKAEGRCVRCRIPAVPGKSLCPAHLEIHRLAQAKCTETRRQLRVAQQARRRAA